MGRSIVCLCAAWLMFGRAAVGQQDSLKVSLRYQAFAGPEEAKTLTGGGEWAQFYESGLKIGDYTLPDGLLDPKVVYFATRWTMGTNRETRWTNTPVALLAKSNSDVKKHDRLWIDWNRDKVFTDDEQVSAKQNGKSSVFGPIRRNEKSYLLVEDSGMYFTIVPTGYYVGEASLNGRKYRIGLIDSNLDGAIAAHTGSGESGEDILLLDLNGDRRFTGSPTDSSWSAESEVLPMPRLVQMPNGRFYHVRAARDGRSLTLTADTRPLGAVKIDSSRFALTLLGEEGRVRALGRNGITNVPSGRYQVDGVTITTLDPNGGYWSAPISFEKPRYITVRTDRTFAIDCGAPFRLTLEIGRDTEGCSFSLQVKDRSGNTVDDVNTPKHERPVEPKLRIASSSGRTVKVLKFHYG